MLSAVNLSDRLSVDVQGAQSLRAGAVSGDPAALRAAAKQFEAMVVQIMIKTMRQTQFTSEGDPFGDSGSLKVYRELLDQQWAQKMVDAKGLGFADLIVQRLGVEASGKALLEQADRAVAAARAAGAAATAPQVPERPADSPSDTGETVETGNAGTTDAVPQASDRKSRFLAEMLPHAREAEAATGVPARFILAHAALESGWGRHEIKAADGASSHNLFGIKATGWSGETTDVTTTEYRQGVAMKVVQRFRAYADYGEGFTDYAQLLQRRYGNAIAAGGDADAFAAGLAEGGYATDPAYADKIRRTIASVSAQLGQV